MSSSAAGPAPPDGRAARWAGQRERRRREFVTAALRAIAAHGPEVSTEQIAEEAGVARAQLYRHFADATELHGAIADQAAQLISARLGLGDLHGTPRQMIRTLITAHIGWLSEHGHLYRYLSRHSLRAPGRDRDAITDVRTTIARQLAVLYEYYLTMFAVDTSVAEPLAFGIVGLVDSSAAQWVDNPLNFTHADIVALLTGWVWQILNDTLRASGVELDPDTPLPAPNLKFPRG